MTAAFTVDWKGPEVLELVEKASAEALGVGAKAIAEQARANIAEHALEAPGGYHKEPGAMQKQISAGEAKRRFGYPPAAYVNIGFPAFQIEYGTSRSKPTPFIKPAVQQKADAVLEALIPAGKRVGL